MVKLTIAICVWFVLVEALGAGERMQCSAEPLGSDWHYRTRVPGYVGDVRGDRCWYDGPPMKPRSELYWPLPAMLKQDRFDETFRQFK